MCGSDDVLLMCSIRLLLRRYTERSRSASHHHRVHRRSGAVMEMCIRSAGQWRCRRFGCGLLLLFWRCWCCFLIVFLDVCISNNGTSRRHVPVLLRSSSVLLLGLPPGLQLFPLACCSAASTRIAIPFPLEPGRNEAYNS